MTLSVCGLSSPCGTGVGCVEEQLGVEGACTSYSQGWGGGGGGGGGVCYTIYCPMNSEFLQPTLHQCYKPWQKLLQCKQP